MRGRVLAGVVGFGCAGLAVLGLVTPAGANRGGGGRMQAGDITADCEDASMNTPRSGGGGIKLTADVADGATVAPGDEIRFRLTWEPAQWSGADLDRALSCVRVKGLLDPNLSAEESPTANDGLLEYRLRIPNNIKPGCDVCVEGFLAGMTGDGPRQLRSERHCFMSGPPGSTPPVTGPPSPPATTPPPAPATTTTTAAPVRVPTELPTEVGGITAGNPGSPATPVTAADPPAILSGELPRTGAAERLGVAGGGLFLALGGLAVMGGARRRQPQ